jgi:hypothetical protein
MKMTRKGYTSELMTKKELQKEFGEQNIIKMAISQQGADFLVISKGELIRLIEVKEVHNKKKYYPSEDEKDQFDRIIDFAKSQQATAELWIYYFWGKGKHHQKEIKILYEREK